MRKEFIEANFPNFILSITVFIASTFFLAMGRTELTDHYLSHTVTTQFKDD
jgi:hypothetical protein